MTELQQAVKRPRVGLLVALCIFCFLAMLTFATLAFFVGRKCDRFGGQILAQKETIAKLKSDLAECSAEYFKLQCVSQKGKEKISRMIGENPENGKH